MCYPLWDNSIVKIKQVYNITNFDIGKYNAEIDFFEYGSNCNNKNYGSIHQEGNYYIDESYFEGNNVKFSPESFWVTPLSEVYVTYLNAYCPCGGTWALRIRRKLPRHGCSNSQCDFSNPFFRHLVEIHMVIY